MARRRNSNSAEGVNLDSLMDALTNVVAVLILVLILVQADVSQKVVEFLEGLKPATPEQVVASEKKVEELEKKQGRLDELLSKEAPSAAQVEAERRQLALLEKDREERKELLVELDELRKLAKKAESDRDMEAGKTEEIQDEIAKLEALLDDTPVLKVEPTVVGIPASRPIPKNAEIYRAIVIHDRVHFIDPHTPMEFFQKEFRVEKRHFPNRRVKQQGADRYIYEPGPILKHFQGFDFRNSRKQKVDIYANPIDARLKLRIAPDLKGGGVSLEELKKPNNVFAKIVGRLRTKSGGVLIFYVHPNSFNTYLQARRVTDKARVPAGWEIRAMNFYSTVIDDIELRRLKEPPPRKPGPERPQSLPTKID